VVIPVALLVSLVLYQQLGRNGDARSTRSTLSQARGQENHRHRIENGALAGLSLIIIAVMCRSWFQVSLMTYLPEWLQSRGYSLAVGGQMLSLLMIASGMGSLTGGTLSDHIGRWQVLALSLGLLVPVHWLFLRTAGPWQVALVGGMGMLIGASLPVGLVMAQEIWPSRVGLASALVMGLGWAPGGLGASVTGFIADHSTLTTGLQSLALPLLVGIGCTLSYVALQRGRRRVEQRQMGNLR
jgi:MFS family permease